MRASLTTAGALAALVLPATAIAADAPTATVTTTTEATTTPAPPVTETTPAAPPASDPAAGVETPTETTPETPAAATPGRAEAKPEPQPDAGSTERKSERDKRDRDTKPDDERSERKKQRDKAAKDDDPAKQDAADSASSAADLLLGGSTRGLADLSVKDFRIPPFLLPIYQAAGVQYGIRWEILAAINEIESDYGRNLSVSTAGALGWMQFMPGTWKSYGVDATGDGQRDPYNPVDAIFAAARYLQASGAATDIRKAIFAYNHAEWYVNDVLRRAQAIARLPTEVVESLAGLTLAQLPVYAPTKDAPLVDVAPNGPTAWATVRAPEDAPVVAVQDATVTRLGESPRWGRYVELRDAYGNRYTYTHLGELATEHLTSKEDAKRADDAQRLAHTASAEPTSPPTATSPVVGPARPRSAAEPGGPITAPSAPGRPNDQELAPPPSTGTETAPTETVPAPTTTEAVPPVGEKADAPDEAAGDSAADEALIARYVVRASGLRRSDLRVRPLRVGSKVMAGTILGRLDRSRITVVEAEDAGTRRSVSSFRFAIRPAGQGSVRIDPRPIIDGWRLLDDAAVFGNELPPALAADREDQPDVGRVLLLTKPQLQQRVLANPRLEIYAAGREDIRAGAIDRRVLATMEYLTAHGLRLTITSLRSGHSYLSASGNVSAHSYGSAMDIAVVNGTVISPATQGPGSITDKTNRLLLRLQGTMRPNQIISLMTYPGTDNTLAMADHDDHIHVGFPRAAEPDDGPVRLASLKVGATTLAPGLRRDQWESLMAQLGSIENPSVKPKVSSSALPDPEAKKRAANAKTKQRSGR